MLNHNCVMCRFVIVLFFLFNLVFIVVIFVQFSVYICYFLISSKFWLKLIIFIPFKLTPNLKSFI